MDFRKVFDTIPEKFDRLRPRYCGEAFGEIIRYAAPNAHKSVLEIGPGTGQATEPILQTGCDYLGIELGEHLAAYMQTKFSHYGNFSLVNADFETHDFGGRRFDLVYSAAAIQWIDEEIAFARAFELLRSGGALAMLMKKGDYKTPDEKLYERIQRVYAQYFHPQTPYTRKMTYSNAVNYGFTDFHRLQYPGRREFSADEYVAYLGTHSDHLVLREPERSAFYAGIREAILAAGDRLVMLDTVTLCLARKP